MRLSVHARCETSRCARIESRKDSAELQLVPRSQKSRFNEKTVELVSKISCRFEAINDDEATRGIRWPPLVHLARQKTESTLE